MTQSEIISLEINETPEAIRQTIQHTRQQAKETAKAITKRRPRRIYLIGNGTSLYSSMAASYTARALATSAADPYVLALPAGEFRNFTPKLDEGDVVVGISASGEFRDLLAIFEELEGRCLRIGITHVPGSSITRLADELLVSAGGPSQMPVMTKTYASTLAAAHLLVLETLSAPLGLFDLLESSALLCETALEAARKTGSEIVSDIKDYEHAFYFGAGPAYAASLEAALKMKEMAMLHAEASEIWEFASGPATTVDQRFFCAAFYTGGVHDGEAANSARLSREWGARVIEFGPQRHAGDWQITVPANRFEPFSTLSLVPPAALLAYRMARARGHHPEQPHWRERYAAQGLTHLMGQRSTEPGQFDPPS